MITTLHPIGASQRFGADRGPSTTALRRIGIALDDQLAADAVRRLLSSEHPTALVETLPTVEALRARLQDNPVDLLLASSILRDCDALDLLAEAKSRAWCRRMLVVLDSSEPHIVNAVRVLGANGAFDCTVDGLSQFHEAIRRVTCGRSYWSSTFVDILSGRGPNPCAQRVLTLSPTERYLFSILGGGCDDRSAAEFLGMTTHGVHEYRKRLHRKLGIRHKGQLLALAIQAGLVRISGGGILRPGHQVLKAQCHFRAKRLEARKAHDVQGDTKCLRNVD